MKLIYAIVAITAGLGVAGCSAGRSGTAGKWQSLFNGENLEGWTVKCKPGDAAGRPYFTVENGTILADSIGRKDHDYVWLATAREYGDFSLRLRFQAYRDSPGNSGVQIRSRYDEAAGWMDGPQVDVNPPGPWRCGMIWDETRGVQHWLWPNLPVGQAAGEAQAPKGWKFQHHDQGDGWNTLEITAIGMRVRTAMNGVAVADYDGAGVLDDAVHREHQVGERGVIALQVHKDDEIRLRFADLEIQER
ncbi:MAG: DUF1080 domain-containing protein [Planctomycetes bacterium]|nr:DUF1080 domain-containing protein [Planctomycetota bacterium]